MQWRQYFAMNEAEYKLKMQKLLAKMQQQLMAKGFIQSLAEDDITGKGIIQLTDDGRAFAAYIRHLFGDACNHPETIDPNEIIGAVHVLLITQMGGQ
jgi:hypothetical protein